jgi:hypothetical protein
LELALMPLNFPGTAEGMMRADWPAAAALVNKAQRELGCILDGGELADLFADNFPWPLDYCHAMRDLVLQVRAEMFCTAELVEELRAQGEL